MRLFFQTVESGVDPRDDPLDYNHIGFTVSDIDAVAGRLEAKGVEFAKAINTPRPGIQMFFLRGPENLLIEVLERVS